MLEGDPYPGLFVIKSGTVKLYRSSPKGQEQIVHIIRSGGCFECAPIFDKGPNPVSAQTLEKTKVYFIPASKFASLINTYPEVVLQIVPTLTMRLRSLLSMVDDFSFRRVSSRLARLLLQLGEWDSEIAGASPSRLLNQQHLACMLGCSRQALNNSLHKLVRAGVIRMEGRHIIVLKPEVLVARI